MFSSRDPLEEMRIALFILLWFISCVVCSPLVKQHHLQNPNPYFRLELEPDEPNCLFKKSKEGEYTFVSPGIDSGRACGLYVQSDPEYVVEFQFLRFDVSCLKGGLISVIDGWELNGNFFPSFEDHSKAMQDRFAEYCGANKPWKPFLTSQNVGAILFRVPTRGEFFKVLVTFRRNPKPCNVLLQPIGDNPVYTLRNYAQRSNCSVSFIFPMSFKILATSIGSQGTLASPNAELETGIIRKCQKRGMTDYVEFKGGDDMNTDDSLTVEDMCGLDSTPSKRPVDVPCSVATIRLVSSGRYDNSLTFFFTPIIDAERFKFCSKASV